MLDGGDNDEEGIQQLPTRQRSATLAMTTSMPKKLPKGFEKGIIELEFQLDRFSQISA